MSRSRDLANWISTGVTDTEIDKLDGFTGTVDDLNYAKDLRATGVTSSEFDQLDTTSGTPGSGNFLRGDKTWASISSSNLTNFQFQTALDSQVSEAGQTFVTKGTNTFTVTAGRKILVTTFCNDFFISSNASYAEWQLSISDGTTTNTEKFQIRWVTQTGHGQQVQLACTIASAASTTITVLQQLRSLDSGYTATIGSTLGVANNVHCYEFSS